MVYIILLGFTINVCFIIKIQITTLIGKFKIFSLEADTLHSNPNIPLITW